jgi:hypothetical protein
MPKKPDLVFDRQAKKIPDMRKTVFLNITKGVMGRDGASRASWGVRPRHPSLTPCHRVQPCSPPKWTCSSSTKVSLLRAHSRENIRKW